MRANVANLDDGLGAFFHTNITSSRYLVKTGVFEVQIGSTGQYVKVEDEKRFKALLVGVQMTLDATEITNNWKVEPISDKRVKMLEEIQYPIQTVDDFLHQSYWIEFTKKYYGDKLGGKGPHPVYYLADLMKDLRRRWEAIGVDRPWDLHETGQAAYRDKLNTRFWYFQHRPTGQ